MTTLAALALSMGVGVAGAAAAPPVVPPGGTQVVSLGDSYASGEGAPATTGPSWITDAFGDSGADGCHRSTLSGHRQFGLGEVRGNTQQYLNVACSGATVASVLSGTKGEPSQLDAIGPRTRLITLSVGANDAGFTAVATACNTVVAVPGAPPCQVALAVANARLTAMITSGSDGVSALERLYRTILAEAPRAELLVTGYPLLFPSEPSLACGVDLDAQRTLNALTLTANAAIEAAAVRAGATYVDLVPAFLGHSSCESDPTQSWINTIDLANPVSSFHPDEAGQAAIAEALADAQPEPAPDLTLVYVYKKVDPDRRPSWGNSGLQTLVEVRQGHTWIRDLDIADLPEEVCGPGWAVQTDRTVNLRESAVPTQIDRTTGLNVLGWGETVQAARHHSLEYHLGGSVPACDEETAALP